MRVAARARAALSKPEELSESVQRELAAAGTPARLLFSKSYPYRDVSIDQWTSGFAAMCKLAEHQPELILYANLCIAAFFSAVAPYWEVAGGLAALASVIEDDEVWKLWVAGSPAEAKTKRGPLERMFNRLADVLQQCFERRPVQVNERADGEACKQALTRLHTALKTRAAAEKEKSELAACLESFLGRFDQGESAGGIKIPVPAVAGKDEEVAPATPETEAAQRAEPPRTSPAPTTAVVEVETAPPTPTVVVPAAALPAPPTPVIPAATPGSAAWRDPLGYLTRRAAAWGALKNPELRTAAGPTPEQAAEYLKKLSAEDCSPVLAISEAETLLLKFPLWLQLQPLLARALEALHAHAARRMIGWALSALMERHSGLSSLVEQTDGESPENQEAGALSRIRMQSSVLFADDDARRWIRGELALWREADVGVSPDAGLGGELPQQIGRMQKQLAAATGHQRFVTRLAMAELCLERDRADLAAMFIEHLLAEAEIYRLLEWEPALYRRTVALGLKTSYERSSGVLAERRPELLALLCRLDPSEAARLQA